MLYGGHKNSVSGHRHPTKYTQMSCVFSLGGGGRAQNVEMWQNLKTVIIAIISSKVKKRRFNNFKFQKFIRPRIFIPYYVTLLYKRVLNIQCGYKGH